VGGSLADKLGGARVTLWSFIIMIVAVFGVLHFMPSEENFGDFWGFFTMFMMLFITTGAGNGAVFRMIPVIFMNERLGAVKGQAEKLLDQARKDGAKEGAAVLGFSSAISAYGAFVIPKSYGTAISVTGKPDAALYGCIVFYVSCIAITWWNYARKEAVMPC
jgi:NNP family nitrate/nitrite transporter-like MFS transporter